MKRINKLLLALFLSATALHATEKSYSFIGIQTGYSKMDKKDTANIGIRYGEQTVDYRTILSYDYAHKNSTDYQMLILQMNTGVCTRAFRDYPFRPYAGLSFGLMEQHNSSKSFTDRGYLYGANTGMVYIAGESLDFDLSYQYLKTHKMKNLKDINNINLAMHYFY